MTEIEKYLGLFSSPKHKGYGHSQHGKEAVAFVREMNPKTLVDVGCGWNEFVKSVRRASKTEAIGVDFACPGADLTAPATSLPFSRKSVDVLTSFDMLEHLPHDEVDAALAEFARVSHQFIFSISYVPSVTKWKGHGLHPTVQNEAWWLERIRAAGGVPTKRGRFILGRWANRPVEPNERVILVGNGPSSTMRGERGNWVNCFDRVVRFNTFAIEGFEPFVGSKTDLWSTFGRGTKPKDESQKPQSIIFTHGEKPAGLPFEVKEAFGFPRPFIDDLRKRVQGMSKRTGADNDRILATSGLTVTLWMLESLGLRRITLIGFDHFAKTETGKHHYWMEKSFGRPKEHDGDVEAQILSGYIESGRVVQL